MTTQERKTLLEELALTQYGAALQELLNEQYALINDVKTCESWEETIGRKKALETLEKLFSFMAPRAKGLASKNQYV